MNMKPFKNNEDVATYIAKKYKLPKNIKPYYERTTGVEPENNEHPGIVYLRFGVCFEYHNRKLDAVLAPILMPEAPNDKHDGWMMVPDMSKPWKMYDRLTWNEITSEQYELAVKDLLNDDKNIIKPFKDLV